MEVWTVSHCTTNQQFNYLKECINSVLTLGIPHKVSVSGLSEKDRDILKSVLGNNVYFLEEKTAQIDHIYNILNHNTSSLNTKIMFLDDDDMLINIPNQDYQRMKGIQVLYEVLDDDYIKLDTFRTTDLTLVHRDRIIIDFSGYMCLKRDIIKFRNTVKIRVKCMADLDLMDYIDSLNPVELTTPFIAHRLWRDNGQKEWCKDVLEEASKMLMIIETL